MNDTLPTFNDFSNRRKGNICHQLHRLRSLYNWTCISVYSVLKKTIAAKETITEKGIASVRDKLPLNSDNKPLHV